MATVAQSGATYNRIAYHATFRGEHGTAIRNQRGEVWFVSDADAVTRLYDADAPTLHLHGRVDVSADQRRCDMLAQTDLTRIETITREARILAA